MAGIPKADGAHFNPSLCHFFCFKTIQSYRYTDKREEGHTLGTN